MSQNAQVLMHLEAGQPITQLEATMKYGILRLSERIRELERLGCVINHESVSVPTRSGKSATVTRYTLLKGIERAA
jgi:DNA-binding HxlR family transcriptional regulator